MNEKFELRDDDIERYGFNNNFGVKHAIINKELNLILVELNVHYSLLPEREFCLLFQDVKFYISYRVESYNPLVVKLFSRLNGTNVDTTEYEYAKVIRDSVDAYNNFYNPNEAWYCVTLTNTDKPKPKSETHRLDSIINSLCLYGRERSVSFADLSKRVLSLIGSHGYDREDLNKFIEIGEYQAKLKTEGKEFIKYWVNEGKNIEGQYEVNKPLILFDFFQWQTKE